MENLRILELFSGIGGMHFAFRGSGLPGEIVAAVDINPIANSVYAHNFPNHTVLNNNIQKLTPKYIEKLNVNTILMSPPCQPFTRVGNQKDLDDNRADALKHICSVIPQLPSIKFILMENVKGFESSKSREMFVDCLKKSQFHYREFILSPTQFGVPNTRHRYYCVARRIKDFGFSSDNQILDKFPGVNQEIAPSTIDNCLESIEVDEKYLMPDNLLRKRVWVLDIVQPDSRNTNCFTKAYTHYVEGTGSILCRHSKEHLSEVFDKLKSIDVESNEYLEMLQLLKLRFFSPTEVSRLMSFPEEFSFPSETTNRQKYRLLGNSINVLVVSKLITLLCS